MAPAHPADKPVSHACTQALAALQEQVMQCNKDHLTFPLLEEQEEATMFRTLIRRWKQRSQDRRQFHQLIAEIDTLSQDDLTELGAFKVDLYRAAHRQVYG